MLSRASLLCAVVTFALSLALSLTAEAAADGVSSNSTYLETVEFSAMVIDNRSGFVEYIDAAQHDAPIEAAPIFRVRPRSSAVGWVVTDCSVQGVICAEIHRTNGNTVIAFKPGAAGDTYSVRGVRFEIQSVGTFAASPTQRKIYWVKFTAAAPLRSGDFMYADGLGVVRYMSADEAYFLKPGGMAFLRPKFLADGPGLLSPNGFPSVRTR